MNTWYTAGGIGRMIVIIGILLYFLFWVLGAFIFDPSDARSYTLGYFIGISVMVVLAMLITKLN